MVQDSTSEMCLKNVYMTDIRVLVAISRHIEVSKYRNMSKNRISESGTPISEPRVTSMGLFKIAHLQSLQRYVNFDEYD